MYGDGVSQRRRHPRSEAGLTANLSNPARRLARGPRVRMQREKIGEMKKNERGDRTFTERLGIYTLNISCKINVRL